MFTDTVAQPVLFADLCDRPLQVAFDQPHASSDGGAVLLKAADRQLGLVDRLAATLTERRAPARIRHSLRDLLAALVHGSPGAPFGRRSWVRLAGLTSSRHDLA